MLFRGRIRVQLKNDDGSIFNPDFPTRDSVLLHLGTMIPQLKSRQGARSEATIQQSSGAGGSSGGGGGNTTGAGAGKKGKGKRR